MLKNSEFPLYERAVMFAAAAHSGMTRKGSRIPYLSHPVEAAAIVAEMTDDEELIAAAVLHDVVEDTPVTSEEVEAFFGSRVAHYVACETEDKREGSSSGVYMDDPQTGDNHLFTEKGRQKCQDAGAG